MIRALASANSSGATASVAPKRSAASRRAGTGSTAMIWAAPQAFAPWMTEMPTPPQPITATEDAASTLAVLRAA